MYYSQHYYKSITFTASPTAISHSQCAHRKTNPHRSCSPGRRGQRCSRDAQLRPLHLLLRRGALLRPGTLRGRNPTPAHAGRRRRGGSGLLGGVVAVGGGRSRGPIRSGLQRRWRISGGGGRCNRGRRRGLGRRRRRAALGACCGRQRWRRSGLPRCAAGGSTLRRHCSGRCFLGSTLESLLLTSCRFLRRLCRLRCFRRLLPRR